VNAEFVYTRTVGTKDQTVIRDPGSETNPFKKYKRGLDTFSQPQGD